jgi:hypothetical protein
MTPTDVWVRVRQWIDGQNSSGYIPRLFSVESEGVWIICVEYVDRESGVAIDGPTAFRYREDMDRVEFV